MGDHPEFVIKKTSHVIKIEVYLQFYMKWEYNSLVEYKEVNFGEKMNLIHEIVTFVFNLWKIYLSD